MVDTFGTSTIEHDKLEAAVRKVFDLTPQPSSVTWICAGPSTASWLLTATWAARSWA